MKMAPVQRFSAGIPWDMHLRAYDAYCKKYGAQPALIDLEGHGCRGGFGTGELDKFIPGWRDELEERRKQSDEKQIELDNVKAALETLTNQVNLQTEAQQRLLQALPHMRIAANKAHEEGSVQLGILAVQPDGSGQVKMRFDADSFFEDLALALNAPPLTEQNEREHDALTFLAKVGVTTG